jgi:hypothetical protein
MMFRRLLRKSFWLLVFILTVVGFLIGPTQVVQAFVSELSPTPSPPVPPTSPPDLVIIGVGFNKLLPFCEGDVMMLGIDIANLGNAAASNFQVELYLDENLYDYGPYPYSLGPGKPDTIWSDRPWTATAGTHILRAEIDTTDAVSESNENNNVRERHFEVKKCKCVLSTSVSPSDGGSISRNPSGGTYDCGQEVTLTANPYSCWNFKEWKGDATGENRCMTINVNRDMEVTAYFEHWCKPDLIIEGITWRPSDPN